MKYKVLQILKEHIGQDISGAEIAEILGVSRTAVWKAVEALRSQGYNIEAVTNKGYRLQTMDDTIDLDEIKKHLKTKLLGRNAELFDEVSSTNDIAKEKAKLNFPEGYLVIAKKQTAGKGRYGRTFHSPDNGSIYMSILLRPAIDIKDASFLTVITSVAVKEAIYEICGIKSKIKWVNDIYIGDKKICGILTEAGFEMETSALSYAVIGIGINISSIQLPEDLMDIADDVRKHATKDFSVNELIAAIINQFEEFYTENARDKILEIYRKNSYVLGKSVIFEKNGVKQIGVAEEIDDDGALIIKLDHGKPIKLQSGEVSIRVKS